MAYYTLTEAQTYIDTYVLDSTAWDDATNTQRTKALEEATLAISNLRFKSDYISNIPDEVKQASVDLAIKLLDGVDIEQEYNSIGVTSQSFSGIRESRDTTIAPAHIIAGIPCVKAWNKIIKYLDLEPRLKIEKV